MVVNEVEYYVRMHWISQGHKTRIPFPKSRPPEIEHIHLDTHTLHEARDELQELQEAKMRLLAEEKLWECRRTGGRGHWNSRANGGVKVVGMLERGQRSTGWPCHAGNWLRSQQELTKVTKQQIYYPASIITSRRLSAQQNCRWAHGVPLKGMSMGCASERADCSKGTQWQSEWMMRVWKCAIWVEQSCWSTCNQASVAHANWWDGDENCTTQFLTEETPTLTWGRCKTACKLVERLLCACVCSTWRC